MRVLVIGANGDTGFQVIQCLKASTAHRPVAMIRNAEQRPRFEAIGVDTVLGDLLGGEHSVESAFETTQAQGELGAVVFAAGSGGKTGKGATVLIDQLGAIRASVAALQAGVKRFVVLSGLGVDRDATGDPIPHWRRAKGRADDFVRTMPEAFAGEGLDWTIVCPGSLHDDDEEPTGVELIAPDGQGKTSRANTAAVLAACLDEPGTVGQTIGVVDGEAEARAALRAWRRVSPAGQVT